MDVWFGCSHPQAHVALGQHLDVGRCPDVQRCTFVSGAFHCRVCLHVVVELVGHSGDVVELGRV